MRLSGVYTCYMRLCLWTQVGLCSLLCRGAEGRYAYVMSCGILGPSICKDTSIFGICKNFKLKLLCRVPGGLCRPILSRLLYVVYPAVRVVHVLYTGIWGPWWPAPCFHLSLCHVVCPGGRGANVNIRPGTVR